MPSVAFAPRPQDFDEDFFGIPVMTWVPVREPQAAATPPLPERPSAPRGVARSGPSTG